MTTRKLKTWHLLLILVLSLPLALVAGITIAQSKTTIPHPKQHTTNGEFWSSIRMKPVTITSVQGHTLYWKFEDTQGVELGSFVVDQYTEGDAEEGKTYMVIYCDVHKTAYRILPIKPAK